MTADAGRGQVTGGAADVYEDFFVPALFGHWAGPVLQAADVALGDRLLDVGCGTGVVARAAAAEVGPSGEVVGLDLNEGMLAVARREAHGLTWRRGAVEALPFPDASFDRVVSAFALMFFDDRACALDEVRRVLVPGGRLVAATWAQIEESSGYSAMVALLRRLFGDAAAEALLAPFCLGTESAVEDLLRPAFPDVTVTRHEGTARFASISDWVHTDIRGWTLADMIDDDDHRRLLAEAEQVLATFTGPRGEVRFPAPALIATATRPG